MEKLAYIAAKIKEQDGIDINVDALEIAKNKYYKQFMTQAKPIPGALSFLNRLSELKTQKGFKLALVSSSSMADVETKLKQINVDINVFDVIGAGNNLIPHVEKPPKRDIYAAIIMRLGVKPGNCVAFEDSSGGVKAARAANIKHVVAVPNDYTVKQDLRGAGATLVAKFETLKFASTYAEAFNAWFVQPISKARALCLAFDSRIAAGVALSVLAVGVAYIASNTESHSTNLKNNKM